MTTSNNNGWTLDLTHSTVGFSVRHMVVAKVRGQFTRWGGELHLDLDDLTKSSVTARIEAASIDTGVAQRDNHLRSADFFAVEEFPELTFASTRIERAGDDYKVTGDLTIRGVTKEVVLKVESSGTAVDPWGKLRAGFSAHTTIDRKAFGLHWNQLLEAGGVMVGEKVEITLDIEAVKEAAARNAA